VVRESETRLLMYHRAFLLDQKVENALFVAQRKIGVGKAEAKG
jgi:hypothetical protein